MSNVGIPGDYGIEEQGLSNFKTVYWNLYPPALVEQFTLRKEGLLSASGAVVVNTGKFTGRSPQDKFLVLDEVTKTDPDIWWGRINQPFPLDQFERLFSKMVGYLQRRDIFIQDMVAGANPIYSLTIRIISENAWTSLFAHNLLRRVPDDNRKHQVPSFTVLHCPGFHAVPSQDGTKSGTFIIISLARRIVLIGGTSYAGEIKKSIFSVLNFLLPRQGILSMHCSANQGKLGDITLFFGLSGTGKTTLSSNPERFLIGDDEHGWGEDGVFNLEGGCYAKTINLKTENEPLIWNAVQRFGSVLENVGIDLVSRQLNFDDNSLTENTRAAYPIEFIDNYIQTGRGEHPENIFFLSADAYGVLPPVARLTGEQIRYYFLSGYTSKLADTETGLGIEPQATFSTCFAAPFLPLYPRVYANLLEEKISRHEVKVWMINTGWTGGPCGAGVRIELAHTRAIIEAVLDHKLDKITTHVEPFFGLCIPETCPGVPPEILDPQKTWADPLAYRQQAQKLIALFEKNNLQSDCFD